MSDEFDFWKEFKSNKKGMIGLIIVLFFAVIAIFAPIISPYNPNTTNPALFLSPPSRLHYFGTDTLGQDLFSRDIYGAQISLIVGISAGAVAIVIGLLAGLISGYLGGAVDEVIMRIVDFFIVIPALVFMIIIAALLGPSLINVIMVIGLLSWAPTARIIRSMVLSIREWPFVESAKANNAGKIYIMFRHIFPNVTSVLYGNAMLAISAAIFTQAALVFLGVGNVTSISWGGIIRDAYTSGALTAGDFSFILPPGIFIFVLIFGFIMMGFATEEIMNPRLRTIKG
ncbi:MAG: ABC transporter permease [Thermoplasmatales archaeon]|jgi:peptide/nickel transport system permease protein|nr:ABC transporter permease [Candidatus Thermoplasmatota archaeon]MCL6002989.1 ABC transporter permease [Candidatus Thermoplasmatota archaeon]MDA8054491.1 ABC transporter permease [Thermoplasmatales archaeon]